MKPLKHYAIMLMCLAFSGSALAQNAIKDDPAYLDIDSAFDLTAVKPTVNINLPKFLLKAALSEFDGGEDDPIAAMGLNIDELTSGIKLVRLLVFDSESAKQDGVKKGVAALKAQLITNWTPIIQVAEKKEDVTIYALGDPSGEKLVGLAMIVSDGTEVVIGNLVGHVPISKVAKTAVILGDDMIPQEVLNKLKQLQGSPKSGEE